MDTIFAFASAPGKAGVAVLRISGPESHSVSADLAGPLPAPRKVALRTFRDAGGQVLDEGLLVVFEKDASFTGELVAEWHLHGSRATQTAVLTTLSRIPGLRPAAAGEFTRRALENGRLDLAQVEGLADVIDAETEAQRQRALDRLGGSLSEKVDAWRQKLVRAAALIEATIDFADEEIPYGITRESAELAVQVIESLRANLAGSQAAERIREGFEVALIGAPNVGKSTLLNRLAGREAAITSEVAGTTRDVIEVRMDIAGLPVTLLDTAGMRETADPVETIGVERARERAGSADLRVRLVESPQTSDDPDDIVLLAKADCSSGLAEGVSGKTGAGVSDLIEEIAKRLSDRVSGAGQFDRQRHVLAATNALEALERAESLIRTSGSEDIAAAELRIAIRALESLIGRVDVEDLLDDIFSSFCIGK